MSVLLEARELVVRIGTREVCCGLDLAIHPGEHWAILGRNGAGKSTLMSVLAGLRSPLAGAVLLAEKSYLQQTPRTAACLRGWLAQHQGDAFASTVQETALIGRHPHLGRWDWESDNDLALVHTALLAVGLHGFEPRDVRTLSGGERQRLAIATLLVQNPRLFLLDEPLTHLDLNHQIAALEIFRQRTLAGCAVVSVLHDPALAWRYADKILLVYGNGQTRQGTRDEMLTEENLSALYGHPLCRIEQAGQVGFLPL